MYNKNREPGNYWEQKTVLRILQWKTTASGDQSETLKSVETACRRAMGLGADLLALQEMFCCHYGTEKFPVYAERGREALSRLGFACTEVWILSVSGLHA